MRRSIIILLASTAFLSQPALAADEAANAAAETAGTSADAGEIIVFGQGETRQVQEVGAADIRLLTPGTSPIRAIEKLPSVNIQASDPFGSYEWSTRVTIRSFSQSQLGFNLDGIPLGDMQYGNHNGLHVSRAISSENIGTVRVSQGSGAIGTQSTNNLGGTVEYFSMDPLDHFAVQANGTYGSDETMRGFVRVNVGSTDGFRGYVSYGYGTTDKYKGQGTQDQHIVNAKGVLPVGAGQIDAWFSYSDRREQDYQDMSLDMLDRLGYGFDNTAPDYAFAVLLADIGNNRGDTGAPVTNAAAGKVYPAGITFGRRRLLRRLGPAQGHRRRARLQHAARRQRQFPHQGILSPQRGHGSLGDALRPQPDRRADLHPHDRIRHQPLGRVHLGRFHARFQQDHRRRLVRA